MKHIVVFVTASSKTEAETISQALLQKKLIACSNMISPVQSLFHWKGAICNEEEVLLILKTTTKNFKEIVVEVRKNHSYEVPEIIALPIVDGSDDYLRWITDETF